MGQDEIVSLCGVASACRTAPLTGIAVKKHRVAFIAESPVPLGGRRSPGRVRQDVTECIVCRVVPASRAITLLPVTIEEHRLALIAATPIRLRSRRFSPPEWQAELETLRHVFSPRGTHIRRSVSVKHYLALIAEPPIRPIPGYSQSLVLANGLSRSTRAPGKQDADGHYSNHYD